MPTSGKPGKQYILTPQGDAKLEQGLKTLFDKCPKQIEVADFCGIHRTTIGRIRKHKKPVNRGSLSQLFEALDRELINRFGVGYSQRLGIENIALEDQDHELSASSSQHQTTTASLSQDLSELLCLLNCIQQENAFRAARATANPAGTFLVRAKDLSLQKWLVNRLVRLVPGYENAYCQPFNVYSPQIRLNFNLLWENLAANLNTTATIENVAEALIERYCHQTVILVLYGVHKLQDHQIAEFIQFWQQLVKGVQERYTRARRSRLILFLVEDTEEHNYSFDCVESIDYQCLEKPLRLSPLGQISKAEALTWFDLDEVYNQLEKILSQEQIDLLSQDISVNDPNINPNEVSISLDEICMTCGLENGIAEIEQYWELSA